MLFLDRLEPRLRWLAFPGFLRSFAILHILVFGIQIFKPGFGQHLLFDSDKIMDGEVWRVVTFLFAETGFQGAGALTLVFFAFMVMILFMMSDALEAAWGVFRTTIFCYVGIASFLLVNTIFGWHVMGGIYLYQAAFFAFATLFPRTEFRFALLIPVEARWIALLVATILVYTVVVKSPLLLPVYLVGFSNYLLWAGIPALKRRKVAAAAKTRLKTLQRRGQFDRAKGGAPDAFHTCEVCGRSDASDPQLEFRVAGDGKEYCEEHLPG